MTVTRPDSARPDSARPDSARPDSEIIETATAGSAALGRPPRADGVAFGLAVVIAGTLGIMATYGEIFYDALAFLVLFAGLAVWAARRPSTRLRWAIGGFLVMFVGVNLVYAIGDLSHPESPAPFVTTTIVICSGLVTIALAVLAARHRPARGALVWRVAAGVLSLAAVGSLAAAGAVHDDQRLPGDVDLEARGVAYPDEVVVPAGSSALFVRNTDPIRHTLVIEGTGIGPVELPADTDVRVELGLPAGSYRFYCDISGHEAMEGTLVVNDG